MSLRRNYLTASHLSRQTKNSLVFVLLLFSPLTALAESIGCDDAFVQLDSAALVINVAATGIDDTANVQCALDVAAVEGYSVVRLGAATYYISGLRVVNFKGTLEGKTKTSTVIEVPDRTVACRTGMLFLGMTPAVIKFVKGEPRLRFLTIRADFPCISTSSIDTIVHFTGESAHADNCDNDVIFGTVDRVILETPGDSSRIEIGVLASAEGNQLPSNDPLRTCKNTLLGTFKLNRSTISNISWGVKTTMKAGAQVDINFNEFLNNRFAIWLQDTNQNTTITANSIVGKSINNESAKKMYWGIFVDTQSADAPKSTRVVVHNNRFTVESVPGASATTIIMLQPGRVSNISSIITNNKFDLTGAGASGILTWDVSNAHVSANNFKGDGATAILVSGGVTVTDCTITANTGLGSFSADSGADIKLGASTSECIVGPDQSAAVLDHGTDNTILPQ